MSAGDESSALAEPKANQYHANYEPRCNTGYSFGTLCHFDAALAAGTARWSSLSQYVEEAQVQNYENTRAQFEAFIDHAGNTPLPSTGTIYWQMNKGWPSLLWDLYSNDGDQAGSYFGVAGGEPDAARACTRWTTAPSRWTTSAAPAQSGLSVESKVYSLAGTVLTTRPRATSPWPASRSCTGVLTPKVPDRASRHGLLRRAAAQAARHASSTATSTGCPPSQTW